MVVTLILIAVTCGVSITCFENRALLEKLLFTTTGVGKGQVYRFVTHGFVHADGQHLFFNMLTFFFFGRAIEPLFVSRIGYIGFAVFYLLGIVLAILPSYIRNHDNPRYASLGASGAVSAVVFVFILLAPWSTIYVFIVPVPAILFAAGYVFYSVYSARLAGGSINHSAHLWGAVYGIVFAMVMVPAIGPHFLQQLANPTLGF